MDICTKDLPATITVDAPIIANLGSIVHAGKLERIYFNNDILAIIGEDECAVQQIKSIHQAIYQAHQGNASYTDYYQIMRENLESHGVTRESWPGENAQILQDMQSPNAIALRLALLEEENYDELLKEQVVQSTGPCRLVLALFKAVDVSTTFFATKVKPHSFEHYGLHHVFNSINSMGLHSDKKTVVERNDLAQGKRSDLSWLEEGRRSMIQREIKIRAAGRTILGFFQRLNAPNRMQQTAKNALKPSHNRQGYDQEIRATTVKDTTKKSEPRPSGIRPRNPSHDRQGYDQEIRATTVREWKS